MSEKEKPFSPTGSPARPKVFRLQKTASLQRCRFSVLSAIVCELNFFRLLLKQFDGRHQQRQQKDQNFFACPYRKRKSIQKQSPARKTNFAATCPHRKKTAQTSQMTANRRKSLSVAHAIVFLIVFLIFFI